MPAHPKLRPALAAYPVPIGQVEPLNGADVGFRPAQVGHDLSQFALAKDRSNFHLLNPPPLPVFD